MHNCKRTRTSLIELALDEVQPAEQKHLLAELKDCEACQEEYATLRSTLRVTDQALRSALPAESFWSGYHARLSQRLAGESLTVQPPQMAQASRLWNGLRRLVTSSVRVPLPAAAALVLLFAVSIFFALRVRRPVNVQVNNKPQPAIIETRIVEVPVIQEKVVTRVVYVEKNRRRPGSSLDSLARLNSSKTDADASGSTALSLVGFKPTDHVKLKIMKGSYRDEK